MMQPSGIVMAQEPQDAMLAPMATPMFRIEQVRVINTTPIQQLVAPTTPDCVPAHPSDMTATGNTPAQVCLQQVPQQFFKVVYEQSGRQYSVQLPHDPGEFITLQIPGIPVTPASNAGVENVTIASAPPATWPPAVMSPFPSVLFMGAAYASFPYFGSRRLNGAPTGMRGRLGGGRRH
jgi:hypothetical protein